MLKARNSFESSRIIAHNSPKFHWQMTSHELFLSNSAVISAEISQGGIELGQLTFGITYMTFQSRPSLLSFLSFRIFVVC